MKNKSLIFLPIFLFLITFNIHAQKTVGGVQVSEKITSEGTSLVLNGAGIREKYFIDLYMAALYTKAKTKDANSILNGNEPIVMKIEILSSRITKEKMEEAITEGFNKSTNGNPGKYQSKIDDFTKALSQDIKKGAKYEVIYNPGTESVKVLKDGILKTTIKGNDFKKIVFGIWLGSSPADNDLKSALLGQ